MPISNRKRVLSTLALVAAASIGPFSAAPAFAHDAIQSTAPAENATVTTAPETVSLTMSEAPMNSAELKLSVITVTDSTGKTISDGKVAVAGTTISTTLDKGSNGPYKVLWRTVSSDGHPIQGSYSFTVRDATAGGAKPAPATAPPSSATPSPAAAAPGASTQQSPATDNSAAPVAFTVGAAALIIAGILVLRRRKAAARK
ncbi:copper resistance protein CopC (plasmid) [Arthrobacter sp. FW305-BF8]|uniref:copper resistance CopC family protein n=1 Tax=Arthrobacter sp. FW305-BF8 TaxID=2879617 RepID=UPI001F2DC813|nr:copper resistance CopC family protein [Arthrobacter sp. FW305-BF8]UKA56621.1 copper resistance protein CopC [Arthrobacter sp. FW305-BF8]